MNDRAFPPEFQGEPPVCAIDFDGVLHDDHLGYHDGTCYGSMIPGSLEAVRSLAESYKIVIYTAKARGDRPLVNGKTGVELVWNWLELNGLSELVAEVTAEKPRAMVYIDDRALRFIDWPSTIEAITEIHRS